jgi:hypothetical protein
VYTILSCPDRFWDEFNPVFSRNWLSNCVLNAACYVHGRAVREDGSWVELFCS